MRPPVQLMRGTRDFSRVSTEDSDIPSSCEMKDEPAFKPHQRNSTLFLFRESRYPLHLRQQSQGPSHIPIAKGRLLLRCSGKLAYLFNRILGISFLLEMIWVHGVSSSSCAEICVPIDLTRVSQGISVSTPLETANSGSLSHTYC